MIIVIIVLIVPILAITKLTFSQVVAIVGEPEGYDLHR